MTVALSSACNQIKYNVFLSVKNYYYLGELFTSVAHNYMAFPRAECDVDASYSINPVCLLWNRFRIEKRTIHLSWEGYDSFFDGFSLTTTVAVLELECSLVLRRTPEIPIQHVLICTCFSTRPLRGHLIVVICRPLLF